MLATTGKIGIPDVMSESAVAASTAQTDGEMAVIRAGETTIAGEMAGANATEGDMGDGARRRNLARPNQNAGGKRAALQGRAIGNLPALSGLQQIVGLALGSPEFQRR